MTLGSEWENPCVNYIVIIVVHGTNTYITEALSMGNSNISTDLTLLSKWSNPGDDFLKNLENSQAKPESKSASYLKFCNTSVKFKLFNYIILGVSWESYIRHEAGEGLCHHLSFGHLYILCVQSYDRMI